MKYSLTKDEFTILEGFGSPDLIESMKVRSALLLNGISQQQRQQVISLGSIVPIEMDKELYALSCDRDVISRLEKILGLNLRFHVGVIFSKPSGSPRTFMHQDCIAWSEARLHESSTNHIQLLWYLKDTSHENGALRVIPGSHRNHHRLHELWQSAVATYDNNPRMLTMALRAYTPSLSWAYEDYEDELTVNAKAGDLIVIDTRMFHAAHANQSDRERTLITLGFFSDFERYSDAFRAGITQEVRSQRNENNAEVWDLISSQLAIDDSVSFTGEVYRDVVPRICKV